ncbi:MAG: thiol-disulfide isomerase-like thioredoxin [Schlesneria sp.]|nr:thiol-disulfide isomerase-like thioredoxin [Schlesneria sp.]
MLTMNVRIRALGAILVAVWILSLAAADSAEGPVDANRAVIYLANIDHVTGRLLDSSGDGRLIWQSPAFATPFEFPVSYLNAVHFPVPGKLDQAAGDYCFELAGGDIAFGSLVGLQPDEAVLDITGIGPLHVDRTILRRMYRWKGGTEVLYFGPSGLTGWHASGGTKGWQEEAGQLVSSQDGAVIRRDFGIPPQARFEFELSWKSKADFELAIGVGDAKSALRAFRFEVWDDGIVATRETESVMDVAELQKTKAGVGRIHLQAFLDQQKGRLLVFSSSGRPLADLTVAASKPQAFGGIQLTNKSGDIRLERLSISRWNGEPPRAVESDKARIHVADGSIIYGPLKSYDSVEGKFVIEVNGAEQRLAPDQLQDVFFSESVANSERTLCAVFLNDQRLSGDLLKVENNAIWLKCPGIREPIRAPIESLRTLLGLNPQKTEDLPKESDPILRQGRLELLGAVLQGHLVDSAAAPSKTLTWKPALSSSPGSLEVGVSGRIVYRDPPVKPQPTAAEVRAMPVQKQARIRGTTESVGNTGVAAKGKQKKPILHLRSGDMIPCDQATIDESGVTFSSSITDSTFIRNDQLKVLELIPDTTPVEITKQKKERLLMLPRMQRDNPPTQLIRSVDGDYLKGRLISMDEQQIHVEIRLETKTLHRDRVARIIWLHADEIDATAKPRTSDDEIAGTRVQALTDNPQQVTLSKSTTGDQPGQNSVINTNRLTFVAQQLDGPILSGRSELLGACRVDLRQIDRLLIGIAIEQDAASLAFHQWKLRAASDPVAAREGSSDGGEGQESALVGKAAPEIELDMLDGSKFRLSARLDKVVILDFWASWCGPCLQVMPQIDKVVHEFADQGVELVAINLEEKDDRIKAALERLKLEMPVALDRDGRVAEKYGATAIPQTVIIDRTGKVARLFVGGGARFGDQLRTAIEAVLSGKPETPDEPSK